MNNFKKGLSGLAGGAVVLLALTACSSASGGADGDSGDATSDSTPVNIAYLAYAGGDFTDAFVEGAADIAEPDGGSVTLFNAEYDPQNQLSQCEDAVTSGRYNAIIIAPVDPANAAACANVAFAAGVYVASVETAVGEDPYSLEPQVDGVVAVAVTPLESQVLAQSELLSAACGDADPCKVIAEVSSPTDRWTNDLVDGVAAELAPRVEIVSKITSYYDPGAIAGAMPDALTANPDTNVFLSVYDTTALAAIPAVEQAGLSEQIKLIGLGGSRDGVAAIESGALFGTTGNWPIQTGQFLATALTQAVNGETVDPQSLDMLRMIEPNVITIDNLSEFSSEWGTRS